MPTRRGAWGAGPRPGQRLLRRDRCEISLDRLIIGLLNKLDKVGRLGNLRAGQSRLENAAPWFLMAGRVGYPLMSWVIDVQRRQRHDKSSLTQWLIAAQWLCDELPKAGRELPVVAIRAVCSRGRRTLDRPSRPRALSAANQPESFMYFPAGPLTEVQN